jgi:hypothetical protein
MRKSNVLLLAVAVQCLVTGAVHAKQVTVKLTQEQVKTTCGTLLVDAGSHFGCKKHCGDGKTCGFSCEKGGKNCSGFVLQKTSSQAGSPSGPVSQPEILKSDTSGFGTQGPAQVGRPPTAATTGRLY